MREYRFAIARDGPVDDTVLLRISVMMRGASQRTEHGRARLVPERPLALSQTLGGAVRKANPKTRIGHHRRLLALSLIYLVGSSLNATEQSEKETIICESLQHCISQIGAFKTSGEHMLPRQIEFADQFQKFGDPALVYLLGRLESEDEIELKIVGAAISQFEEIDERHLQRILVGIDRDVPWLPGALGSIRSEAAAKIAVELYVKSRRSPDSQIAYAIAFHGDRALPFIIDASTCETGCGDYHTDLLSHVLGKMTEKDRLRASELIIEALHAPRRSVMQQANLLSLFDGIGMPGLVAEDELVEFRRKSPILSAEVDRALVGIRSNHSGRIFKDRLKKSLDIYLRRDLAEVGRAATDAGPAVVELLSHPDMHIRLWATRALGFIEYRDSVPDLVSLLDDPRDVRVNWAAAESLGRIGDKSALEALEVVRSSHWYPAVKNAAGKAIAKIGSQGEHQGFPQTNYSHSEFFRYEHFEIDACDVVALKAATRDKTRKISRGDPEGVRQTLAYDSYVLGFGASDETEQHEQDPGGVIVIHPGNIVEHREDIVQVPDVALRVESGWLAASSRGEFGGELMHIPDEGQAIKVLDSNVEGIHLIGNMIVAITGLAHLSSNEGMVFRLETNSVGAWKAKPWMALPGAPRSSWPMETGELLVNTYSGGSILLSEEGEMRMATCVH